jgi:hypothetical protein
LPASDRRPAGRHPAAVRRTNAWDERSIHDALEELLRGKTEWPTYRWFIRQDAKSLRDAVTRHGGAERWARELGLVNGDRGRGGTPRWSDERIRSVLTPFLAGRTTWPMRAEFDQAGLSGLRQVLWLQGSLDRWAAEFGLPRRKRKPSTPRRARRPPPRPRPPEWPFWTEARIQEELARFLAGRPDWPRFAEFVAAGKKGLYQAVLAHGGSDAWARRMGVVRVDRHAPRWTDDRVRERLGVFLAGRKRKGWPTEAEFSEAGEAPLMNAVRRLGGSERWAAEFGLETSRTLHWNDAEIERAIGPLVRDLGRWPTKAEFRRAGLSKALAAVYTHGGRSRWCERFGVQTLPHGPVPNRRVWTAERIEQELRAFLADHDRWPGARAFEEAGRGALYHAAWQHGGIAYWRRRLHRE